MTTPLYLRPQLNGDTRQTLVNQYSKLATAIIQMTEALGEAAPHGRNYQHLANAREAQEQDRRRWGEARNALAGVEDYANAMLQALLED
jgi:hypothetical protein